MDTLWAKHDGPDEWHPLVAHSADVAATLEMLLKHTRLGARMARLMGREKLKNVHVQRLCVLAALHDAGKANPWFQNRSSDQGRTCDHVTPVVHMLHGREQWARLAETMALEKLYHWFGDEWDTMDWLQLTWSHHGRPVAVEQPDKNLWPDDSLKRLSRFLDWARRWYPDAFHGEAPPLTSPPVQHLFNGVLTLADWMGSDTDLFELDPNRTEPDAAIDKARELATDALDDVGLTVPRKIDGSLSNLLGGYEPYDIQEAIQSLAASPEGTLTVLESATGSGKTEGALGRYARLLEKERVDSMYFAVPTRAAAKQLHGRIKTARTRMFGADWPPVHLAVPGYLKVDDVEGTRFGWQVRWDEDIGPRGWAAESSKRYTASPIAVGTIDQVLMSTVKASHAHLRLAGLARSFLVVDEVHASSAYMNELLQQVLSLHHDMGGHSLLMSATLGAEARSDFTGEAVPEFDDAKAQEYPRLTHVNGSTLTDPDQPDAPGGNEKTVEIDLKGWMRAATEGEDAPSQELKSVAQRAQRAASEGAHVLVIRNTVAACQSLFDEIDDQYGLHVEREGRTVATPHHSRYCAADRACLDNRIKTVYGKNEEHGVPTRTLDHGVVTVATQTVEQSLDIDADLLITDLCPMDVLLQRIGRLHRHNREGQRPTAYDTPRCIVLTPSTPTLKASIDPDSGKGYPGPGLGSVYPDLRMIEATWTALRTRARSETPLNIPDDNRALVEEATHPDQLSGIGTEEEWRQHAQTIRESEREDVFAALNNLIDRSQPFLEKTNRFSDERPKTRLGDEGIVVALPDEMTTPFGHPVEELTLSPYHFDRTDRPDNGEASRTIPTDDGFAFTFGGEDFTYTALGIQKQ